MPKSKFSDRLHESKYRGKGESFREAMSRNADAVTEGDPVFFQRVRDLLVDQSFLMAGRNQAALGSPRNITPFNCFASGTIEDSFVDGSGSIMKRATQGAQTMRLGGGIGYDFSTLRPSGDLIRKLGSQSSGPVSFMQIYNSICLCVASSGHRRGAQMGVLRIDHPDIEQFIRAKQNETQLTGFNISIAVTDEFMRCLKDNTPFPLRWEGRVYQEVSPQRLWSAIMRSTYDYGEPGILFIDRINEMNNLRYCESIATTTPCGEQPLPPFGACLLGSWNLTKYITEDKTFDYPLLRNDVPHMVRAMDNIIDIATYPLYEQEKEAKNKRRMGIGISGLANALEYLGCPYGSEEFLDCERQILTTIRDGCYRESIKLAKEKGSFPLFSRDAYLRSKFIQTLPSDIQQGIYDHGIRNSHLTSIAPTGTISLCADNISPGVEPVPYYEQTRILRTFDGEVKETIPDYGVEYLGVHGKTIDDVTVQEHLDVLAVAAELVDSAVSKTVNIRNDYPWDDFKEVYVKAWRAGCKGITTYRAGGKREGILTDAACTIDPETGHRDCEG